MVFVTVQKNSRAVAVRPSKVHGGIPANDIPGNVKQHALPIADYFHVPLPRRHDS